MESFLRISLFNGNRRKLNYCRVVSGEGIRFGQRVAVYNSAIIATLAIAVSSPTESWAEDLYIDNRREKISSQEVYETIKVGGSDENSYLDIVDGGNVHASEDVVIGDYYPLDGKDKVGVGTITVSGDNSRLTSDSKVVVGGASTGTLVVTEGGTVSAQQIVLGNDNSGDGTLVIGATSGSEATMAGALEGKGDVPVEIVVGDGDGTILFNHTHDSYEFDATVMGIGDLVHEAGTTHLTGDMSGFAGTSHVLGGVLSVDTDFGGSAVVEESGTLTGSGTVSNLTFETGATYYADPTTGALESTGAVTISDGVTLKVVYGNSSNSDIWSPTVVLSGETITGQFDGLQNEDYLFINLNVDYLPNSVTVAAERNNVSFADLAWTANQKATAGAVDTLAQGNTLYDSFAMLESTEAANIPSYLDQLSGEIHASVQGVILSSAGDVLETINRRANGPIGDLENQNSAQASTFGANDGVLEFASGWTIWADGYGSLMSIEGDGNAAPINAKGGGLLTGIEGYFVNGLIAGVVTGYDFTRTTIDDRKSNANIESLTLGAYLRKDFGPIELKFGSTFTNHEVDTQREIEFADFLDTSTAVYGANSFQAFGEVGYTLPTEIVQLTPFAGVAVMHLARESFSETGGDAALNVNAAKQTLGVSTLGLRTKHQVASFSDDSMKLSIDGALAWKHSFGDVTSQVSSSLVGSQTFTISGAPIDTDALMIQTGAALSINEKVSISGTYAGEIGANTTNNLFKANLSLVF